MGNDFRMSRTIADWFDTVEIKALTEKQSAFVEELLPILETYAPTLLDRNRSSIEQSGDTIDLRLAHRTEPAATIEVEVDPIEITVRWLSFHTHFGDWEGTLDERPSTSRAVDAIASILRGDSEIEETYWRNRLIKSRMIDVSDPSAPMPLGETGPVYALLLLPGKKEMRRRSIVLGSKPPDGRDL